MAEAAKLQLSVITLGHVHEDDIVRLTPYFSRIEQLVLDVAPRDRLSQHRAELNRAIDAATADWVLIVRERESIDEALAKEIAEAAVAAKARGFRIRAVPFYAGAALHLDAGEGEVRLFHRRNYMRYANKGQWDELTVQGTVVRLANALRSVTFETSEAHRDYLAAKAKRQSSLRRVLTFLSYAVSTRARDRNTLRYLWIEAAYDVSQSAQ
ncbi:MAG TPA: hypothetical protein VFN10_07485 [Thermoanaerobaculia bacterium]|nr:hypothetical protein [Thermoanaerobaculia bacterium]